MPFTDRNIKEKYLSMMWLLPSCADGVISGADGVCFPIHPFFYLLLLLASKTLCGGPDEGCLCTEEGWGPEAATEDIQPVEFSDFYLSLGNGFDVSLICLQGRRTKLHAIHMSASVHSLLQSFIVTKVHSCDNLLSWDNNTEGYCLSSQHLYIQSQQDFIPFLPLLGHVLIW